MNNNQKTLNDRTLLGLRKRKDKIDLIMSGADVSTAQKLARECVRKKYKGC